MNNNKTDITCEEKFLIGLCRLEFSNGQINKLRALASDIREWKYIVCRANEHGVAALVCHNLEKLDLLQYLPSQELNFLRNILMISMTRNVSHLNETTKVLELINGAGIKTVLLKGLALEITVYGNTGLRQMTDVDVLISREECLAARDLLMKNGFTSLPLKSPVHKPILPYIGKHLPSLIKNGFSFEIHHELFGSGKSNLTRLLYDESIEDQINGERVFIPKPQDFLLYLVKHLFLHEKNNESQIRLYTDLVVLIEKFRDEIFKTDLLKHAEEAGIYNTLLYKLEIMRKFWELKFPGWLNEIIDRGYDSTDQPDFYYFLKSPKNNPNADRSWFYRYNINEIPCFHRKILYILGDLFPSISFMKKRYKCGNNCKALLYYPHRLGKLWYLIKK